MLYTCESWDVSTFDRIAAAFFFNKRIEANKSIPSVTQSKSIVGINTSTTLKEKIVLLKKLNSKAKETSVKTIVNAKCVKITIWVLRMVFSNLNKASLVCESPISCFFVSCLWKIAG